MTEKKREQTKELDREGRLHAANDKLEVLKVLCKMSDEYSETWNPLEVDSPAMFWGGLRGIVQAVQDDILAAVNWEEPEEGPKAEATA